MRGSLNRSKEELVEDLKSLIDILDDLPPQALREPVSHMDLLSSLRLVSAIFCADCKESI